MLELFNAPLTYITIYDLLNEISYFIPWGQYYEKFIENPYLNFYSDLLIDLGIAAEQILMKMESVIYGLNMPYKVEGSAEYYDGKQWFDTTARLLNYSSFDYMDFSGVYASSEKDEIESSDIRLISLLSKQQRRKLFVSVFDVLAKVHELRTAFQVLVTVMEELESNNKVVISLTDESKIQFLTIPQCHRSCVAPTVGLDFYSIKEDLTALTELLPEAFMDDEQCDLMNVAADLYCDLERMINEFSIYMPPRRVEYDYSEIGAYWFNTAMAAAEDTNLDVLIEKESFGVNYCENDYKKRAKRIRAVDSLTKESHMQLLLKVYGLVCRYLSVKGKLMMINAVNDEMNFHQSVKQGANGAELPECAYV